MKTYISDIIPKIQRYSKQLDNLTLLINQHWVVIDDVNKTKIVYIFRQNNELLISQNGKVEKAKWEYLDHNSLLIDKKDESYLFKQGFFDENVLALKIDGTEEYAFLVNETKYDKELNTLAAIVGFLNEKYIVDPTGILTDENQSDNKEQRYTSPRFTKAKIREETSFWGNVTEEIYLIQFADEEKGQVYLVLKNNQAYFKVEKNALLTLEHYYKDLDFCINALHYYLITGKRSNNGYIVSYS